MIDTDENQWLRLMHTLIAIAGHGRDRVKIDITAATLDLETETAHGLVIVDGVDVTPIVVKAYLAFVPPDEIAALFEGEERESPMTGHEFECLVADRIDDALAEVRGELDALAERIKRVESAALFASPARATEN